MKILKFTKQIVLSAVAIVSTASYAADLPNSMVAEFTTVHGKSPFQRAWGSFVEDGINHDVTYAIPFAMSGLAGPEFDDAKVTWSLGELSPDGQEIASEIVVSSKALSRILPSGRNFYRIKARLTVESCDGEQPSQLKVAANQPIEKVIGGFSRYKFAEYMRCTLHETPVATSEDGDDLRGRRFRAVEAQVDFLDSGDIVTHLQKLSGDEAENADVFWNYPNQSDKAVTRYTRVDGQPNLADDQAAEQAARVFTSLLKKYGQSLIDLRARNATSTQKLASLQGFFNQNKAEFVSSLAQVNALFGKLSLMSKVRIVQSIQDGYAYVHYLENQIATQPMFDSVVGIGL